MAFSLYRHNFSFPAVAASAINPKVPVALAGTSSLHAVPITLNTQRPFGFNGLATAGASGLNQGEAVTIYEEGNYVKAVAAASLGVAGEVGVASTNGALGPIVAASGSLLWSCGVAVSPAAAGETFTLFVKPRQLGGLA